MVWLLESIFWVFQKHPALLIPVCMFDKSNGVVAGGKGPREPVANQ